MTSVTPLLWLVSYEAERRLPLYLTSWVKVIWQAPAAFIWTCITKSSPLAELLSSGLWISMSVYLHMFQGLQQTSRVRGFAASFLILGTLQFVALCARSFHGRALSAAASAMLSLIIHIFLVFGSRPLPMITSVFPPLAICMALCFLAIERERFIEEGTHGPGGI